MRIKCRLMDFVDQFWLPELVGCVGPNVRRTLYCWPRVRWGARLGG